ncbi:hypothetical protein BT96DRAFT_999245 [Gymnopus androsaceus JB14]|uniref:ABM domain-containing protein n=1 Tax=Gymnopus androsaceus JB14 TaxID=1447944 RepID=A0A6A4H7C5_9AGAR|nr:hypothetical protein BT96DRAFT_999245 [Gymnopus androsaceus JB14]
MASVVSLTVFPPSETFLKAHEQYTAGFDKISAADGLICAYHGLQDQEEGAKQGYFITVWESAKRLKMFRETASEKLVSLAGQSLKASAQGAEFKQYQFISVQGDHVPAFDSKITEIVIVTPHDGVPKEVVKEATLKAHGVLEGVAGRPAAVSESIDGSGVLLVSVGWESVAQHRDTVKNGPFNPSAIRELRGVSDLGMSHVSLKKNSVI